MRRGEPSGAAPVRVHVAGLASRTHLVYAASYLRHLMRRTTGPVEVVARPSGGFRGRTPLTDADVRAGLPRDPLLTHVAPGEPPRPGTRAVLLSVGVPGIKPYLRLLAGEHRRVWVVVSDEGIGTYGNLGTRRAALRREGGAEPWASVVAAARTGADRLLTDQRWRLYDRRGRGGWHVREEVADEFRRAVMRSGTPRRTAVYLTQPWVELGLISAAEYRRHLDAVAEACASAGLGLQVRPHPVEDPRAYAELDLITGALPAELDARVVDAAVVLGGPSTALLNLAAVHGVPTIWLRLPEVAALEAGMSGAQRSLFGAFVPLRATARELPPLVARALR